MSRPPLPPFTLETATQKVRLAEDAWNGRDPTGVLIYDQDGHPLDAARRRAGEPSPPESVAPVTLGNDVWVGSGAVILKGVTVGDRAVVAARSVVTKDVPADSVVAGNPARVVLALPLTPAPLDAT